MRKVTKRIFDLALTIPLFIMSLPIQAVVAALVARKLGHPVIFEQSRPGLGGKPFVIRKFRTMHPVNETLGHIDDESRLDGFGKWLRSTSLDELPSLWNVLKGDMSLVGPRPLLMMYLNYYTVEQIRRHDVRPGVTGLAQTMGRNELPWAERLCADVWYVDNYCMALDLKIVVRTIAMVVLRRGITESGHATSTPMTSHPSS